MNSWLLTSEVDPLAIYKNLINSFLELLSNPSAILLDIEREALLIWLDMHQSLASLPTLVSL